MQRSDLPRSLGAAFSVGAAFDVGVSPSRLRADDLCTPFHGVRTLKTDPTPETAEAMLLERARQYLHRMSENEFFSHVTAAVIWNLPLPYGVVAGRPLDVAVTWPRRAPESQGINAHAIRPELAHARMHADTGLAVCTPATTWALLGGVLTRVEDLVAVGDAIVRVPMHENDAPPLGTIAQLRAAMDAGRRTGIDRLRAALPLISDRSRSRPETWLRLILLDAGLPAPAVNYDVVEGGQWLGQVDLAYPHLRIAIEYEGEYHLTDPAQWDADIARMDRLVEAGWRVIRVTKKGVFLHPMRTVERVRLAVAAASR
ncbi:endonuclease domain-containing protein [Microbacterium sp.]|uniref:endonuclease domain-containing protein n=1 Tax=Microbacterium sp. TaxID=51671 RepID=UPI0039E6DCB6